eukprot:TRINITY_DN14608_c0_g2_i1.p1 TRINITY_DN14608_c0_g2~~TRINITY_DN14608_c0_g2_i1.p1  ORF type:complete len:382 (-),score=33.67 TRINITY_DN14608_c0_g2_i1:834-1979(-)
MGPIQIDQQVEASDSHIQKAWQWYASIGHPRLFVAPMVDGSELPFRMLCRQYGAQAAYSPMFNSGIFVRNKVYREAYWSTCHADRPLIVQFCGNDPNQVLKAAQLVQKDCDAIDLNLGCPQRIAKRGRYGAFLMENWELIAEIISTLAQNLDVPVTAKIRVYPDVNRTIEYAKLLQSAGCSLLAVHGRFRDQKNTKKIRADWDQIKAVKNALQIPVLANGNISCLEDCYRCMEYTGCEGVMSAEGLLSNPQLFDPRLLQCRPWDPVRHLLEYLQLCGQHPVPPSIVKAHAFKLIRPWLNEHVDLRDQINKAIPIQADMLSTICIELIRRIRECGRDHPISMRTEFEDELEEKEELKRQAIEQQRLEEEYMEDMTCLWDSDT